MKKHIVILAVLVLCSVTMSQSVLSEVTHDENITIIEKGPSRLVFEIAIDSVKIKPVMVNGQTVYSISISDLGHMVEPAKARLPIGSTVLGLPPAAEVDFKILNVDYRETAISNIEMVSSIDYENFLKSEHVYLEPQQQPNGWYPENFAELEITGFVREQRIAKIIYYPVLYNYSTKKAKIARTIRLAVSFNSTGKNPSKQYVLAGNTVESAFESYFQNNLINFAQAKSWRVKPNPSLALNKNTSFASGESRYKVTVEEDGLYSITGDDLQAAGLSLGNVNPNKIRLTNNNVEIPILVTGDSDGSFDSNDEIRFLGKFNRGDYSYLSPYTPSNTYWLSFGESNGLRIVEVDGGLYEANPITMNISHHTVHYEKDNIFERLLYVPHKNVDHWFWEKIQPGPVTNIELQVDNPAHSSGKARVHIQFRGLTHHYASPDHHVIAKLNGYLLSDVFWNDQDLCTIDVTNVPNSILLDGTNLLSFEMFGDTDAGIFDIVLLDWIEVTYERELKALNDTYEFTRARIEGSLANQFTIDNFTTNDILILDANGKKIANYVSQRKDDQYAITFQDNSPVETNYYIYTSEHFRKPEAITKDIPSDLRSNFNGADYIIITHKDFSTEAERLAEFRSNEGLRTKVVDLQDIYDEFGTGSMNPENIKDFVQYAYNSWTKPALTYVLLLGDCTHGYDKNVARNWKTPTYLPTMMEYTVTWGILSSDNYFACVNGDDVMPDIYIGRLPVSTPEEAEIVIAKITQYQKNSPVGEWRRNICLITGSGSATYNVFERYADDLQEDYISRDLSVSRISTDAQSEHMGSTEDLVNLIDQGSLLLNFIGHGGGGVFSDEELFEIEDVGLLNNTMKFPILFSLTCFIGYFDSPTKASLGEELLRATGKGIVAHFGSAGRARVYGDQLLNIALFKSMFQQRQQRIGQITTEGKLGMLGTNGLSYPDEAISFTLLGDPATVVALPPLEVELELEQSSLATGETLKVEGSIAGTTNGWVKLEVLNDSDSLLTEKTIPVIDGSFNTELLYFSPFVLDAWSGDGGEGVVRAYYWCDETDGTGVTEYSVNAPHLFEVFIEPEQPSHMDSVYVYTKAALSSELDPTGFNSMQCYWSLTNDGYNYTVLEMAEISDGLYRTNNPTRMAGGVTIFYKIVLEYGDNTKVPFESETYKYTVAKLADLIVDEDNFRLCGSSELRLSAAISNGGESNSGPFVVQFYDGNPEGSGVQIGADIQLANISAGEDTIVSTPWSGNTSSAHYFHVLVDAYGNAEELNENNNHLQKRTFILTKEKGTTGPISSGDLNFLIDVPGESASANSGLVIKTLQLDEFQPTVGEPDDIIPDMKLRSGTSRTVYSVISDDSTITHSNNYKVQFYFDKTDTLTAQAASFGRLKLYGWDYHSNLWATMNAEINFDEGTITGTTKAPFTTYGIFVNLDAIPPVITLRFEGQNFVSGDYVPSNPRISAIIEDESPLDLDFHSVDITLNGQKVSGSEFAHSANADAKNMVLLSYAPNLGFGEHSLQIDAYDVHGNKGSEVITFSVSEDFSLLSIANHPNPFPTETVIAFTLTADAEDISLRVYSTSGRLIRDLSDDIQSHVVGYIEVVWDGTDDNGDEVANGVYYLKLNARKEEEKIETIEKMAKIR